MVLQAPENHRKIPLDKKGPIRLLKAIGSLLTSLSIFCGSPAEITQRFLPDLLARIKQVLLDSMWHLMKRLMIISRISYHHGKTSIPKNQLLKTLYKR
jgi:hypothetical protein